MDKATHKAITEWIVANLCCASLSAIERP